MRAAYPSAEWFEERTGPDGELYSTIGACCRAWGVNQATYSQLRTDGLKPADAYRRAPKAVASCPCADHEGREYPSEQAMCDAWGMSVAMFKGRLRLGWSLEEALTVPKNVKVAIYRRRREGRP